MLKIIKVNSLKHPEVKRLTHREPSPSPVVLKTVQEIISQVRLRGHSAVLQYARKYDGLKGALKISEKDISKTAEKTEKPVAKAIERSIERVYTFHKKQMESSWQIKGPHGELLGQKIRPLRRVGLYVPGGAGSYPSTLIMTAVPAQVAGVKEIAVVSPTAKGLAPAVAYALKSLGLKEVYRIGGAQAVAMLAFGTSKVERVDKIVGPGNIYATLAKREVFGHVDIDMIAGPSEILVLADESSDPDWIAADLLSQAEHGSGYEAAVLVTTSLRLGKWVGECIREQVENSPRKEMIEKCLKNYGRAFVVPNMKMAYELCDAIAPEHMEVLTRNAKEDALKIQNAGALFIGPYSSEPVGDYLAGPNHVLPTNGSARFSSPLGTYDFLKRTSWIEFNRRAMDSEGRHIAALARAEGFVHHAIAVEKRL